ncbi:serine/threonine-protein kinase STY46-like isoform X1 [Trifolium pratense]|uniref:Uncharacterized protein n=2 Tax=Trifolium pratense TaxID=57577 RepID=A0ACB0J3G9_TRIPR|nr:serine/threonine-protein kinase STY46-like isoform X1 [Trifolium pratense]CAJ2638322.1 unnamed protein product [Trifolium pratense]
MEKNKATPPFREEIVTSYFSMYALDVNVERAEDVHMHKRLLHLAHDPANRPQIEIRLVQAHPCMKSPSQQMTNQSFSAEVWLLLQLTALLAEVGLNIQEAHAFSTTDGYSLDVFVVEGWPYEETEKLKETLEKEVLKIERHERSSQQSISSVDERDHNNSEFFIRKLKLYI